MERDIQCTVENINDAVEDIMVKYGADVQRGVRKAVDTTMRKLVDNTKSGFKPRTNRSKGEYVKQIASKENPKYAKERKKHYTVLQSYGRVWYVKGDRYRVAHLINSGHKNARGRGFVRGDQHITNAAKTAEKEFMTKLRRAIENA